MFPPPWEDLLISSTRFLSILTFAFGAAFAFLPVVSMKPKKGLVKENKRLNSTSWVICMEKNWKLWLSKIRTRPFLCGRFMVIPYDSYHQVHHQSSMRSFNRLGPPFLTSHSSQYASMAFFLYLDVESSRVAKPCWDHEGKSMDILWTMMSFGCAQPSNFPV